MEDVVLVAVLIAFFVICVGYVVACGWIMGPDEDTAASDLQQPETAGTAR